MKGEIYENKTGLCLLALLVSFLLDSHVVIAKPQPGPPDRINAENFIEDAEAMVLRSRLRSISRRKQEAFLREKELTEEQMTLQALLEAKIESQRGQLMVPDNFSEEDIEILPIPSAMSNPNEPKHNKGDGSNYTGLCFFKICNMGRK